MILWANHAPQIVSIGVELSMTNRFDWFLSQLYAGAAKTTFQRDWLAALRELLDADMTSLSLVPPRGPVTFIVGEGFRDSAMSNYLEYYQHIDPGRESVGSVSNINIFKMEELYNDVIRKGEYYKEFYSKLRMKSGILLSVDIDSSHLVISLLRKSAGAFTDNDIRLLSRAAPHFKTAWQVQEAVAREARRAQLALSAFESVTFGFALVSASGAILHANSVMRSLLDAGVPLSGRNGKLEAEAGSETAALYQLVRRTAGGDVGAGRGYLHLGSDPTSRLEVLAAPLPADTSWPVPDEPAVAIFATNPKPRLHWSAEQAHVLLGLTPKEAEVAAMLANGMPTKNIAAKLGIRTSSVRAHIKAILAKTNTHSQAELLNMLFQNAAHLFRN